MLKCFRFFPMYFTSVRATGKNLCYPILKPIFDASLLLVVPLEVFTNSPIPLHKYLICPTVVVAFCFLVAKDMSLTKILDTFSKSF